MYDFMMHESTISPKLQLIVNLTSFEGNPSIK